MGSGIRSLAVVVLIGILGAACGVSSTPAATATLAPTATVPPPPSATATSSAASTATPVPSSSAGPAHVTGSAAYGAGAPGTQKKVGDVTQLRDELVTGTYTMDDPRISGAITFNNNLDAYTEKVFGPEWGKARLENAGGAWVGTCTGAAWSGSAASEATCWLVGSGSYAGYSSFLNLTISSVGARIEGIVFPGSLPPTLPMPSTSPAPATLAGSPAHATGTATFGVTAPPTQSQVGEVTQLRDETITGTYTMSDPRISGKVVLHNNVDAHPGALGPQWGTARLENGDGAWDGTCTGGAWAGGDASSVSCWLVGSGSYSGYTSYLSLASRGPSAEVEGIIYPGLPPKP